MEIDGIYDKIENNKFIVVGSTLSISVGVNINTFTGKVESNDTTFEFTQEQIHEIIRKVKEKEKIAVKLSELYLAGKYDEILKNVNEDEFKLFTYIGDVERCYYFISFLDYPFRICASSGGVHKINNTFIEPKKHKFFVAPKKS